MKSLKRFINNQDLFGHPISIKFNKKGDHHTTLVGGVMSILLKVFLLFVLVIKTRDMFSRKDAQSFLSVENVDYEDVGTLSFEGQKTLVYVRIQNTVGLNNKALDDDELKEMLSVFEILHSSYQRNDSKIIPGRLNSARRCKKEDFARVDSLNRWN